MTKIRTRKKRKKGKKKENNFLIVLLGPTASGKSELAVTIAKLFKGEIVSADSRQVYRGMDIGTGKVPKDKNTRNSKSYFYKGVRHHLIDVASPKRKFTAARYQKLAERAIQDIAKRGKLPIICGGTGFYIDTLIYNQILPAVKPDWVLRKKLEKKPVLELWRGLKEIDPRRAAEIDRGNKRRLIRALEIVKTTGRFAPKLVQKQRSDFRILKIGLKKPAEEMKTAIEKRFQLWLKQGLIREIKTLRQSGLSWRKIEEFGLGYRRMAEHLQGRLSKKEALEKSISDTKKYAKRQMAWFKKDKNIVWVNNFSEAEQLVKEFLKK